MICDLCCAAADRRAPKTEHCTDPGCTCGHRTDRYRALDGRAAVAAMYADLDRATQPTEVHPRAITRVISEPFSLGPVLAVLDQQAAEADAHTAAVETAIARVEAEHGPNDVIPIPRTDTCTATLGGPLGFGTAQCTQSAGHYDQTMEPVLGTDGWATDPGGWHWSGPKTAVWADFADGATPHTDTTEN